MEYKCEDCGRKITRAELEDSDKIRCPECGSYRIKKIKD